MAKLFNDEVIDYLRDASQKCRYDPNEFDSGDTFIVQRPRAGTDGKPAEDDGEPQTVEGTAEKHPECKIKEPEEGADTCHPSDMESEDDSESPKGGGDAKRKRRDQEIDDLLAGLSPSQMSRVCTKCRGGSKLGTPIRCILGPFPDEPIMGAVDKLLTIIGITLGGKEDELSAENEEMGSMDEETECDDTAAEDTANES